MTLNSSGASHSGATVRPGAGPFFHVGILAADLEAAISHHARTFGVAFLVPVERHLAHFVDDVAGTSGPLTLRYTYSVDGPPRYELLEAHAEGLYRGHGLHHVGAWSNDVGAEAAELERRGVRREAAILDESGDLVAAYFRPEDLGGTRLELVCKRSTEFIESWVRTGVRWVA